METGLNHLCICTLESLFQQKLQRAISSWLETGIYQKMENEIKTSPTWRDHFDETSFWTKKDEYGNKPLTLIHVLPSIMVLGFGLIPSITIFTLEILLQGKRTDVKSIPEAPYSGDEVKPLAVMQDVDNKETIKDSSWQLFFGFVLEPQSKD